MIHVGIDPDLHGALAVLDPAGALICVADLPVISDRALKWIEAANCNRSSWAHRKAAQPP